MKPLTVIALAILAAATWWLAFTQEPDIEKKTTQLGHKIDYFLKDFEVLSMTLEGKPKQRIKAEHMEHFVDDDSTEMTRPIMTMYSPEKPDLHIHSETGYISSDGELVLLNGAVNIKRDALKNIAPLEIDTHNLRVQLPNDFAETDEFVKIKSGINTIEGIGLRAHFREPINIKILEQVRGLHEIN
ncbi:MAG: LPS export ABC transporter periplasmic protein LptC [Cycloclasticus sp.]|jgi:lipopolysaccharide export system protein LptC|nr:MAG: LPS export ABC transporter periplasmic protein LptC [Cycloclasticus sp. Phe_18]MBV1912056.1 LPS export ABC transporter periplasmic protein LptC [Cycloclasticus sp.]MDF1689819.1 LPS export ABC transporter periplasmic protein LptC [Cycloclasticus sp.]MEE4290908.1 LPS export ABC transporter periplasmic protein LptC [Cycloclasticus sp.]